MVPNFRGARKAVGIRLITFLHAGAIFVFTGTDFILDLNLLFLAIIHLQASQSMDLMDTLFTSNFSFKILLLISLLFIK